MNAYYNLHLRLALVLLVFLLTKNSVTGQSSCEPGVPYYTVDLTGSPGGTFQTPSVVRNDQCCSFNPPNQCVGFQVTLDPNAQGLAFEIVSGALPPGALFYQINCGDTIPVGSAICLPGGQTVELTFCKPGNNANIYQITSIPGIILPDSLTTYVGCSYPINVTGPSVPTITWTDITSGTGAYNSYLSCTTGCSTSNFTPPANAPSEIKYKVCGYPSTPVCNTLFLMCDTVVVKVNPLINASVNPSAPEFCANTITPVQAVVPVPNPSYSYTWYNGFNAMGTVVGTGTSYLPSTAGNYSLYVEDMASAGCSKDTVNFTVTILPLPVFDLGPNQTICQGMSVPFDLPDGTTYSWSPISGVVMGSDPTVFTVTPPSTTTYSVTATNGLACTSTDQITLTLTDCIDCPPPISGCSNATTPPYANLAAFTAAGGNVNMLCALGSDALSLVSAISNGNSCPETVVRTYRVTDNCGNSQTCTQTVTFNDLVNPVMSCPGGLTAVCSASEKPPYSSWAAFTTAGGSASDNCTLDTSSFVLVSAVSNGASCPEQVTRTYRIEDLCGNMITCTQTVTVDDNTNPVINCPAGLAALCAITEQAAYTTYTQFQTAGGSASDNCSLNQASFTLQSAVSNGQSCPETITRTYRISDSCGNQATCTQQIVVNDNTNPVLNCPPTITATCQVSELPAYATFTAFQAAGGSLTYSCAANLGSFGLLSQTSNNASCPETVTRVYKIENLCGTVTTCNQTVTVDDNTPPTLSCPPGLTAVCNSSEVPPYSTYAQFTAAGGVAADHCAINAGSFTLLSASSNNGSCPEVITRTYQIADLCGNTSVCSQNLTVDDNVSPIITCPSALTATCSATEQTAYTTYALFTGAGGSSSDNCGINQGSFTLLSAVSNNASCPEIITRTYQ
ncbi:MAG: hypothetical protein RI973_1770, partial [Bacteroidota bacterium]